METPDFLGRWLTLSVFGTISFFIISFRQAIARNPETRDEYLPGAEHRQIVFGTASLLGLVLTIGRFVHGGTTAGMDLTITGAAFMAWLINHWFLRSLRS